MRNNPYHPQTGCCRSSFLWVSAGLSKWSCPLSQWNNPQACDRSRYTAKLCSIRGSWWRQTVATVKWIVTGQCFLKETLAYRWKEKVRRAASLGCVDQPSEQKRKPYSKNPRPEGLTPKTRHSANWWQRNHQTPWSLADYCNRSDEGCSSRFVSSTSRCTSSGRPRSPTQKCCGFAPTCTTFGWCSLWHGCPNLRARFGTRVLGGQSGRYPKDCHSFTYPIYEKSSARPS